MQNDHSCFCNISIPYNQISISGFVDRYRSHIQYLISISCMFSKDIDPIFKMPNFMFFARYCSHIQDFLKLPFHVFGNIDPMFQIFQKIPSMFSLSPYSRLSRICETDLPFFRAMPFPQFPTSISNIYISFNFN